MQVDVDIDAVFGGDSEHHIEVAVQVCVQADRIDTADHVSAFGQGGIEKFDGARCGQQALLGECDDLDVE